MYLIALLIVVATSALRVEQLKSIRLTGLQRTVTLTNRYVQTKTKVPIGHSRAVYIDQ